MRYTSIIIILFISASFAKANGTYNSRVQKTDLQPKQVVRSYLLWYKSNRNRLENFELVKGGKSDERIPYSVDFEQTERYLAELEKCGFVSGRYITKFREYFKNCDRDLKRYPQYDGPAQGFGFDLVLKAHDYNQVLNNIKRMRVLSTREGENNATIKIKFPTVIMVFTLARINGAWLIDTLGYEY